MEGLYCTLSNYCSGKDFISALQTISEDLSVVSLPPIPKYNREDPGKTITSLINTVWTLMQHRQQFVDSQQNLEQQVYILSQEIICCKEKEKKLQKSLRTCEDCLSREKKRALLLEIENSQTISNSTYLKEEIQELNQRIKSRDIQFKHDLQRQNNEISELQSKLRKILSKEKGETWRGPVENSTKCKLADDEKTNCMKLLYQKSIHRLENNIHTLIKENLELRKLLDNVSDDLAQLMAQTCLCDNKGTAETVT